MSGLLSLVATAILATLAAWAIGGWILRTAGAILAVGGLLSTATTGWPTMAVGTLLGVVVWLAGHWPYAFRHHCFRSPLARRVFIYGLPAPLNPTSRWGVPNTPPGCRR